MNSVRSIPQRIGGLVLLGVMMTVLGCVDHTVTSPRIREKQTHQDSKVMSLDLTNVRRVVASTRKGRITLNGQEATSARLAIRKKVRASTLAEALRIAEAIRVDVRVADDELVIGSSYPQPPLGVEVEVDYELACPAGVNLDLDVVNGGMSIKGMCGTLIADVANAKIEIAPAAEPGGAVAASAVNGLIAVDLPAQPGYFVTATTSNGCILGGIVADQCRSGRQVVTVGENGGIPCDLRVVNGNIEINRR